MNNFYIYNVFRKEKENTKCSVILFCPEEQIEEQVLKSELKEYFQKHILPDELVVIGGQYIEAELKKIFIENAEDTFININKIHKPELLKSITVFSFNYNGQLNQLTTKKIKIAPYQDIISEGLIKIFKERGGVIEAHQGQHYVFPSGKHSSKFLRTGNILLYSSEIYFICFSILRHFNFDKHQYIFCDTSSINSLAMALVDLKSRFFSDKIKKPLINSFKSYSVFEEEELVFGKNSLFLVSSSTSGGIIERLKEKKTSIPHENIILLFFLGDYDKFEKFEKNIVCNLTKKDDDDKIGISKFPTYNNKCKHCEEGSIALKVIGDTFLSEKPKINKVLLTIFHAPKDLSSFVEQFLCNKRSDHNVIKCHFKENPEPDEQYDVYIDMDMVFDSILKGRKRYEVYDKKLKKRINLNIPSNTKYIVTLNDSGSQKLAKLILREFEKTHKTPPKIVKQGEISRYLTNEDGSVVVACSSMVNGGNLLYISKVLRAYDQLSTIYLIGLIRTKNEQYHDFLNKNLSQGATLGNSNSPFIAIERLYLPEKYTGTNWLSEKKFVKKILSFLEKDSLENTPKYSEETLKYFAERLNVLKSIDTINKGLANRLFHPNIYDSNKELILNKNFAFLNFEQYYKNISQSEVYFIISCILNNLRETTIKGATLKQQENERNVLDPGNFLRFNDGIIQSCLLRATMKCELDYSLDENLSSQMRDIILDIVKNEDVVMRESLMEFTYALAAKKIKLYPDHYETIKSEIFKLRNELLNVVFENLDYEN